MIDLAKLKHEDEDVRRWEIIEASKVADENSIDVLLEIIERETVSNKRHIVRALANIGGGKAEAKLLSLATSETGEILGDICKSLGQLRSDKAVTILDKHQESKIQWVSQNAVWALKKIENDS